ncbi:hypothetical protein AMTRI_Chr04g251320 [Amborella trichopoda]
MKSPHFKPFATLLPLFFLTSFHYLSLCASDSFVYGSCSQIKFDPTSSYQSCLNSIMASAANSASLSTYNNFTINHSNSINQAIRPNSRGGTIQLQDCFLKYDNINFIGVLDTSLIYTRCSPEFSSDSRFYERREEVFAELQQVGLERGVAQCIGDLEPSDCSACLTQAVGRLRSLCAFSVSGEVFMGKCYVRHSSDGLVTDKPAGIETMIKIGVLDGIYMKCTTSIMGVNSSEGAVSHTCFGWEYQSISVVDVPVAAALKSR